MANASYLTLDKKGRATLPEEVREALGVGPGDIVLLERTAGGGYELVAAELVPRDQKWFYHPEMQERVRAAEEEIRSGAVQRESAADLVRRLEGSEGSEKWQGLAGSGADSPPTRVSRTRRPKAR